MVDFSSEDDEEKISYCKHCLKFGFRVRLRNRIYPDNEPMPVDNENWLQCHECGLTFPVHQAEKEAGIKEVVETTDNPFDSGKSFLGIDSRNLRNKKRKDTLNYIDDPDVTRELKKGHILLSYSEHQP
jgi:hypothetical protein